MDSIQVSEIWIYPVKSLGGIRLERSAVLPKGLAYDRRWMLIDGKGRFLSQREIPLMSRFQVTGRDGRFQVSFGDDSILLEAEKNVQGNMEKINAGIWNDRVQVYPMGDDYDSWFSKRLGFPCRLVFFPEEESRPTDPRYALTGTDQVSLADAYPILLIGQSSLDDLNQRLGSSLPMNRFRPNIVCTGSIPYDEDRWHYFRIGPNRFAAVKPCSRCVLITIDPLTGSKGKEPLTTLAAYRRIGNEVYFGQNIVPVECHNLSVGDEIQIASYRTPPVFD